jgi:hypothetical protein
MKRSLPADFRRLARFLPLFCLACSIAQAWSPGTSSPTAVSGFTVNTADRRDVLAFYQCIYRASESYAADMAWTGSVDSGVAGTTSATFKDHVRRRINYYRALVALPADIVFDATSSAKDQEAALLFAANNAISHTPPNTWTYYTANAAEAAASSNIAIGTFGPGSVNAYIRDDGSNNIVVGHRRWLHYSRAQQMGTGDVPADGAHSPANAIWVSGNFKAAPTPSFIAWPNAGYCPFSLIPARWSLSYPGANFAAATVTLTQGGNPVAVTVISRTDNGYGDNTIVWEPASLPSTLAADLPYAVTVGGISGAGVPTSYSYTVTLFDPAVLGESVNIAGSATPPTSGAAYTFNSIAQADAYQLNVSTYDSSAWTEGAEDATSTQVIATTSGDFTLRQTAVKRTGSKAFQLTFPTFTLPSQSFELDRDIVPTASSQLQFYDLFRFVTTASRLSAEITTDGGLSWTELWDRNGNGSGSSSGWDTSFQSRSVSLAAYAGLTVRVRFIFRHNNSAFLGATSSTGVFIDDIAVTAGGRLVSPTTTALGAAATGFTLNATTAGSALAASTTYYLRVRPQVGTQWFGYGPSKIVTAQALTGFPLYVATQYPALSGVPSADYDADGIADVVEYAFGLNPTVTTSSSALPAAAIVSGELRFSYTQPGGVTGLAYGAQSSTDLVTWQDVSDTGSGSNHIFSVSLSGQSRLFLRHKITVTP